MLTCITFRIKTVVTSLSPNHWKVPPMLIQLNYRSLKPMWDNCTREVQNDQPCWQPISGVWSASQVSEATCPKDSWLDHETNYSWTMLNTPGPITSRKSSNGLTRFWMQNQASCTKKTTPYFPSILNFASRRQKTTPPRYQKHAQPVPRCHYPR